MGEPSGKIHNFWIRPVLVLFACSCLILFLLNRIIPGFNEYLVGQVETSGESWIVVEIDPDESSCKDKSLDKIQIIDLNQLKVKCADDFNSGDWVKIEVPVIQNGKIISAQGVYVRPSPEEVKYMDEQKAPEGS